jgi:hypothetical protein
VIGGLEHGGDLGRRAADPEGLAVVGDLDRPVEQGVRLQLADLEAVGGLRGGGGGLGRRGGLGLRRAAGERGERDQGQGGLSKRSWPELPKANLAKHDPIAQRPKRKRPPRRAAL